MAYRIWFINDFISHFCLILVINSRPLGYAADIHSVVSTVLNNIPLYLYITDKGGLLIWPNAFSLEHTD